MPAIVPAHLQDVHRNRKGWTSHNALGVVDFDMLFSYVLTDREGQAVLTDAWEKTAMP